MEIALRNQLGLGVEEHLEKISQLWADFNQVAVNNPNAWIREAKTAEEIRTPSQINRPVSFPYPKFMNSNDNVDQAAALIMCSEEKAQTLGISRDKWIYPWAGSDAHDHYYLSNRDNFYSSPAIRFAGNRCLEMAGVNSHDLDMVDVYSCFPVAVQIASRELNLDTTKPLTVTGGLTWSGGPLNNYVMNSIARMAELLRENQGQKGLITANGGYIKHAFGVYSTEPPSQPYQHADLQNEVDQTFKREVVIGHSGDGVVEGYSIVFGPNGMEKAFVAARLADERRAWGMPGQGRHAEHGRRGVCGRSVTFGRSRGDVLTSSMPQPSAYEPAHLGRRLAAMLYDGLLLLAMWIVTCLMVSTQWRSSLWATANLCAHCRHWLFMPTAGAEPARPWVCAPGAFESLTPKVFHPPGNKLVCDCSPHSLLLVFRCYLWLYIGKTRQTWHDLASNTCVVHIPH